MFECIWRPLLDALLVKSDTAEQTAFSADALPFLVELLQLKPQARPLAKVQAPTRGTQASTVLSWEMSGQPVPEAASASTCWIFGKSALYPSLRSE